MSVSESPSEAVSKRVMVVKTLAPVPYSAMAMPEFKRSFIEGYTSEAAEDDSVARLPLAGRAFFGSKAGEAFPRPTEVQRNLWPILLSGSDVVCVVSQTDP